MQKRYQFTTGLEQRDAIAKVRLHFLLQFGQTCVLGRNHHAGGAQQRYRDAVQAHEGIAQPVVGCQRSPNGVQVGTRR